MTREEAIRMLRLYEVNEIGEGELKTWYNGIDKDMREAFDMAIEALSKRPEDEWKYIEKDGNPKEMGTYYCLVVAPTEYNGKTIPYYEYDLRWFGEGETAQAWKMDGQPDSGLVWTEQTGSMQGEQVYAWRELPDMSNCLVDPQAFERLCKIK